MTVLALGVAIYAIAVLALPAFGPPFIHERRAIMPLAVLAHLAGGSLALALGPWQFLASIRANAVAVHRWTGRAYVVAVLIGGIGGMALAPQSQHGLVTHVGFGLLAILWLGSTGQAYWCIRHRDVAAHQRWMTRSYALTLAAVTLRIWLPLSQVAGIPFADAYQVVAWLCWVPNLVVAEWLIIR